MADNDKKEELAAPLGQTKGPAPGAVGKPPTLNTDAIVDQWFQEFFPGARTARGEAWWQEAARAKEILKQRLKGE